MMADLQGYLDLLYYGAVASIVNTVLIIVILTRKSHG